jgi:hypothetical protein
MNISDNMLGERRAIRRVPLRPGWFRAERRLGAHVEVVRLLLVIGRFSGFSQDVTDGYLTDIKRISNG